MQYPNKTFVADVIYDNEFGKFKRTIIVVGNNKETACQYLKDKVRFTGEANDLTWLMDTNHPTIYDQTGNKPLEVQAKILYNTVAVLTQS